MMKNIVQRIPAAQRTVLSAACLPVRAGRERTPTTLSGVALAAAEESRRARLTAPRRL